MKQTDLIDATQRDTLSLTGEVTGDAARIKAAEEAKAKLAAEVKALEAQQQQDLFGQPADKTPRESPKAQPGTLTLEQQEKIAAVSDFKERAHGASEAAKPEVEVGPEEAKANKEAQRAALKSRADKLKAKGQEVEIRDELPDGNPESGDVATVDRNGAVVLHLDNLTRSLDSFADQAQADRWLSQVLNEEGIHAVALKVISDNEAATLWRSTGKVGQFALLRSYIGKNVSQAESGYSDSLLGHELIRRRMQRMISGETTEQTRSVGWTERGYQFFLGLVERVQAAYRKLIGSGNDVGTILANRLQAALRGEPIDGVVGEYIKSPSATAPTAALAEELRSYENLIKRRQVFGIKEFGEEYTPIKIKELVDKVQKIGGIAGETAELNEFNTDRAFKIFEQMSNPETRGQYADEFAKTVGQSGAAAAQLNELWAYAWRMLLAGDYRLLAGLRLRSGQIETRDFGTEGSAVGASASAFDLRLRREATLSATQKAILDHAEQQMIAAGGRLGVGQEAFGNILRAINDITTKINPDEWDILIRTGKDSQGRTLDQILNMASPEMKASEEIIKEIKPESVANVPIEKRPTILETVYEWMKQDVRDTDQAKGLFINGLGRQLMDKFGIFPDKANEIAEQTWNRKITLVSEKTKRLLDAELRALDNLNEKTAQQFISRWEQAEWQKPPLDNQIRDIITYELKRKDIPTDAKNIMGLRTDLEQRLVAKGLSEKSARELSMAVWDKKQKDFLKANMAAMKRASESTSIRSLIESIKSSPYLAQSDPAWRKETARLWFASNGILGDAGKAAVEMFDAQFQEAFMNATERIAQDLLRNSEPRTVKELLEAVRSGLLDPAKEWTSALAERNKFKALKPEQFKRLAELEVQLSVPSLNPYEQAAIVEQMMGVMRHAGDQTGHFWKAVGEAFAASLLSGIRTITLQIGQPLNHHLLTWGIHSAFEPRDFMTLTKAAWNAAQSFVPQFRYAWVKDASAFDAESAGLWKNELKRQFEMAQTEFKNKKHVKAIGRFTYAWQQYVIRTLKAFDQAAMSVVREYSLALYGSMAMRAAGFNTKQISELVKVTADWKTYAYEDYIAKGKTKLEASVMADYDAALGLKNFFANQKGDGNLVIGLKRANEINEASIYEAHNMAGRRAPGVSEFDEGLLSQPMNWLMTVATDARRKGGIPSIMTIMAVGFMNVPFRASRYAAGWSPYGIARWGIHTYMQGNKPTTARLWLNKMAGAKSAEERATFWKQSYKNDLMAKARLREALTGTGLMLAFLGWQASKSTADDDAEKRKFALLVTGNGPSNKTMRDSWTKRGFQPYMLHVIVDGKVRGAIPMTRSGEKLAYPLGIAAALDDVAWKNKQNMAMGRPVKDPLSERIIMGIGTYYNIVGAQGIFQAAGHVSQLAQGGGGIGRAIGTTAVGAASAIAIPGKSLLSGITEMVYGQVDRSSLSAAMVANIPIVNALYNGHAINRFGDVIGDRSWYAKLIKLGAPIAIRVSDTPENRSMYQMILDKGTAPPDLRRYIVEEKYGPLNQDEWNRFSQKSGAILKKSVIENLAQLQSMPAQAVHQFMVNAGSVANNQAAASLNLDPIPQTGKMSYGAGSSGVDGGGGGIAAGALPSLPKPPRMSSLGIPQSVSGSRSGGASSIMGSSTMSPATASMPGIGGGGAAMRRAGLGSRIYGRTGGTMRGSRLGAARAPRLVTGRLSTRSGRVGRGHLTRGRSRRRVSLKR